MSRRPINFAQLKTVSLKDRPSKVSVGAFAKPLAEGASLGDFLDALPDFLGAADLLKLARGIAEEHKTGKMLHVGMGAHVIKVGLSPLLIDQMKRGRIKTLSLNGAGIIHDTEIAMEGQTSEEVAEAIRDGSFGMVRETAQFLNQAINAGVKDGLGIGASVGRALAGAGFPYLEHSLLAQAHQLSVPVTVHVALGTDIIHMHPEADGAAIGEGSMRDFRLFCEQVAALEGGTYLNIGSAVVLPEVFLKAVSIVRNLGHPLQKFTTANMDFIQHYRPRVNVLTRPTADGGRCFALTGMHEIMVPLLFAAVDRFAGKK